MCPKRSRTFFGKTHAPCSRIEGCTSAGLSRYGRGSGRRFAVVVGQTDPPRAIMQSIQVIDPRVGPKLWLRRCFNVCVLNHSTELTWGRFGKFDIAQTSSDDTTEQLFIVDEDLRIALKARDTLSGGLVIFADGAVVDGVHENEHRRRHPGLPQRQGCAAAPSLRRHPEPARQ